MKADVEKTHKVDGKLKRKDYEKALRKLQVELCHLQDWVKYKGLRAMIVFEGRDAAGKGGTIKALTERVSPRVFRVVRAAGALRPREVADVHAALHGAFSGRRARSSFSTEAGTTGPASNT